MAVYVVGDVHGHLAKLLDLLSAAGLIDTARRWTGGTSKLWFVGDFFDRGPFGIEVVELIMQLQNQAAAEGGEVRALLGNHEVLFLAAHRFHKSRRITSIWKRNGGRERDMQGVTSRQIAWLRNLPALALAEDRLFMHADAMLYLNYGASVSEVSETISELLRSDRVDEWDQLLDEFSERMAFISPDRNGIARALECLETFGGMQIIHGHTPIQYITDSTAPRAPYIYDDDLCVNVDGGMYLGAPGFVFSLPA